jgi:tyrosyl-tRNA synthetase
MSSRPTDAQLAPFLENSENLVSEEELASKLRRGQPLRVKFGCDPSAPDLHLGHLVVLDRLRVFQEFGHIVIFLVGDFTARIGDPSGRSKTRPALSLDEVRENARTYEEQVSAVLDTSRCEIRFNGEWMDSMTAADLIRLASQQPVARMLERDDFKKRYQGGVSIRIHEFLYPLVQAYDSVALRADVEVGGSDQLFNLLLGREIQRAYGQEPQIALTYPLMEGTDGVEKMSKSLGNAIGLREPPEEMYGKTMSIPDGALDRWIALVAASERDRLAQIADPRERKAGLARALVSRFHGPEAAEQAEQTFERVFRERRPPTEVPEFTMESDDPAGVPILAVLVGAGLAPSRSEAKRLVAQGGVSLDQKRVADPQAQVAPGVHLVQVGRRRFLRVRVELRAG